MSDVIVHQEGPVLRISLNRPERRNALSHEAINHMLDILEPAAEDDGCRVVVINGEGTGFCAGDDLKGMDYARAASHSISIRGSYTLEDTQEGITAFLEKRPAKFTGR